MAKGRARKAKAKPRRKRVKIQDSGSKKRRRGYTGKKVKWVPIARLQGTMGDPHVPPHMDIGPPGG